MIDNLIDLTKEVVSKVNVDPTTHRARVIFNRTKTLLEKLSALDGTDRDRSRLNTATAIAQQLEVMGVEVGRLVRAALIFNNPNLLMRITPWLDTLES